MDPAKPTREEFEALLTASMGSSQSFEGRVVTGKVTGFDKDLAVIDVGLKSEGCIPLKEFASPGADPDISIGDMVEVYVERMENMAGEIVLSHERARREAAWDKLEKLYEAGERVNGTMFSRVKGGFMVDLAGAVAFLPGSQVDIRPIRDVSPLMNIPQPFQVLKMDRKRGNIVVSRRTILEEARAEQRSELIQNLEEKQIVEGIVKNVTDYGAFVDLGGIDGLLHVTDMSYRRISHPSEIMNIGDTIKVEIIRINKDTQRVSLGMKHLESNPWEGVAEKYPVEGKFKGRVTNIADYGAFVEMEPGVEGLVHVSEMSWTKKNIHPGKIVSTSQEVEVVVLEVDEEKRRISLGFKQVLENPWQSFMENHPVGAVIEGEIKNITEFGLFVGLEGDVDGMVHASDAGPDKSGDENLAKYNMGDIVKAVVLEVDVEKERVSLGIKQLSEASAAKHKKNDIVTCIVTDVKDAGIEVRISGDDENAPVYFIKRTNLSRDRDEQRADRFHTGQKLDTMVASIDRKTKLPNLSIKALQIAEEKKAVAQYGSPDSGASLGDILGAALKGEEEK